MKLTSQHSSRNRKMLAIKTVTWLKDSHSLFDYQFSKNITKDDTRIALEPSFVFLYRSNENSEVIFKIEKQMKVERVPGSQLLGCFEIVMKDGKYVLKFYQTSHFDIAGPECDKVMTDILSADSNEEKKEEIFFIVRSLKDSENEAQGYRLASGQKLKVGRVEFNVKVIKQTSEWEEQNQNLFDYEEALNVDQNRVLEPGAIYTEREPKYFLCTPCNCQGSMSYVHFQCLYQWLQLKVKKQKMGLITQYNFTKFECEICKKPFPRFIIRNGIKHDLLPIQKPAKPYLILSSSKSTADMSKSMYIINYSEQKEIKIGRNNLCDMRIPDISISRHHARIQSKNKQFYIYDSKSKFGTIINEPNLELELEKIKRGIQIGRSVMTFQLEDRI